MRISSSASGLPDPSASDEKTVAMRSGLPLSASDATPLRASTLSTLAPFPEGQPRPRACCAAHCAVCGSILRSAPAATHSSESSSATAAASPSARIPSAPTTRSQSSTATLPYGAPPHALASACASPHAATSCCVSGRGAVPALQTQTPHGMEVPSLRSTESALTCLARVLSRTVIPAASKAAFASPRSPASNCGSSSPPACSSVILTRGLSCGYTRATASLTKSASSAASSTPVAPPPTTTKLRHRFRASVEFRAGESAVSSACAIARRSFCASAISLTKWHLSSTPGTPKSATPTPQA
mmetsp:Transcript_29446/g.103790  ORF Transcript_29446/g.103790 Transcript_29446/m.103790 type:complete len:300 (+) Transcript_29446:505-1404(+)